MVVTVYRYMLVYQTPMVPKMNVVLGGYVQCKVNSLHAVHTKISKVPPPTVIHAHTNILYFQFKARELYPIYYMSN